MILGRDPELASYKFAASKQQLQLELLGAQIFNMEQDLDTVTEPYLEQAWACNFNLEDPIERLRLLFSELMDNDSIYFLQGWEMDKLCEGMDASANEVEITTHKLI